MTDPPAVRPYVLSHGHVPTDLIHPAHLAAVTGDNATFAAVTGWWISGLPIPSDVESIDVPYQLDPTNLMATPLSPPDAMAWAGNVIASDVSAQLGGADVVTVRWTKHPAPADWPPLARPCHAEGPAMRRHTDVWIPNLATVTHDLVVFTVDHGPPPYAAIHRGLTSEQVDEVLDAIDEGQTRFDLPGTLPPGQPEDGTQIREHFVTANVVRISQITHHTVLPTADYTGILDDPARV